MKFNINQSLIKTTTKFILEKNAIINSINHTNHFFSLCANEEYLGYETHTNCYWNHDSTFIFPRNLFS